MPKPTLSLDGLKIGILIACFANMVQLICLVFNQLIKLVNIYARCGICRFALILDSVSTICVPDLSLFEKGVAFQNKYEMAKRTYSTTNLGEANNYESRKLHTFDLTHINFTFILNNNLKQWLNLSNKSSSVNSAFDIGFNSAANLQNSVPNLKIYSKMNSDKNYHVQGKKIPFDIWTSKYKIVRKDFQLDNKN